MSKDFRGVAEAKCIVVTAICVSCPSVLHRIPTVTLLHGPRCKLGNGRGCPLVVHYWTNLQSLHGFRCYDSTALDAKYQRVLVLAVCLVFDLCALFGLIRTVFSPMFRVEAITK